MSPSPFDAAAELGDEYKDTEGYWYSKGITIVGFLLKQLSHGGAGPDRSRELG
ncbi:MAG: hypothetical protein ACLRSD_08250 [Oscillibacter sp.]